MRTITITATLLVTLMFAGGAWAQSAPLMPRTDSLRPPDLHADTLGRATARQRLEADGYGNVSSLLKDRAGNWRGKAVIDGRTVDVTVDRYGNVVRE